MRKVKLDTKKVRYEHGTFIVIRSDEELKKQFKKLIKDLKNS